MTLPVALFFGTRPQVIKASILRDALSEYGPVVAVDSGQHYDYAMHQVHYDQLGIRPPDAFLGVGSGTHAGQTAGILTACENWLAVHPARLAIVVGDTNTTLACALAAAKRRIPVAHVEAGLRAGDRLMAEEINRRVVDALAQWLFAPCARAAAVLEQEHPDAFVADVGDVSLDVLQRATAIVPALDTVADGIPRGPDGFIYATLHRAELVESPSRLRGVIEALSRSPLPVILAAHPRTVAALTRAGVEPGPMVHRLEPVGYLESLALTMGARAIVTDSGGLQREAYWLGKPCLTVRQETEWVETSACGANRLVPPEQADRLPAEIATVLNGKQEWSRSAYGDGRAAARIAEVLWGEGSRSS